MQKVRVHANLAACHGAFMQASRITKVSEIARWTVEYIMRRKNMFASVYMNLIYSHKHNLEVKLHKILKSECKLIS